MLRCIRNKIRAGDTYYISIYHYPPFGLEFIGHRLGARSSTSAFVFEGGFECLRECVIIVIIFHPSPSSGKNMQLLVSASSPKLDQKVLLRFVNF